MGTEDARITVTWEEAITTVTRRTATVTPEQFQALLSEHAAEYADDPAGALDSAYSTPRAFQAFLTALALEATVVNATVDYDVYTPVEHDAGEHWCSDCQNPMADHCSECGECDCSTPNEPCDECGECGCEGECVDEEDDDAADDEEESD